MTCTPKQNQPLLPIDPNLHTSDVSRLSGQNAEVLKRLEHGPAFNDELAQISMKYTSRISDVRRFLQPSGRTIKCERGEGGRNLYRIVQQEAS